MFYEMQSKTKFATQKNKKQKQKKQIYEHEFYLVINGTERYKIAINQMCSSKYLTQ